MRVAIVGSGGQLGAELVRAFAADTVIGLTHERFELEAPDAARNMLAEHLPDLVINTAAFHNVERCENEPERAFAVNAVAVERLASACHAADVLLAHISTDYVFDGSAHRPYSELDAARPVNTYGVSKLAGELLVRKRAGRAYIFRTSGLYAARGSSTKGKPFIERILRQAAANEPLRVVDDIRFSPSYAPDVACAIRNIVARGIYGLYHVTNSGTCSWYEFAVELLRQAGYTNEIQRVQAQATAGTARRPAYSALAAQAMEELGLSALVPWQDGIRAYLQARAVEQV